MSDKDRIADDRDCGGDVAAYALGALDEAETRAFRAHLEGCAAHPEDHAASATRSSSATAPSASAW